MAKKQAPTHTYVAVYALKHDGVKYQPGDSVEMPADQGMALVRRGVLIEESAPAAPATPPTLPDGTPPADDPNKEGAE